METQKTCADRRWWIVVMDGELLSGAPSMEEALASVRELLEERLAKNQFVRSVDFRPATERLALAAADGLHVPAVVFDETIKTWDLVAGVPPRGAYFGVTDETYLVDSDGIPWLVASRLAGEEIELPHPIDQLPGDVDYYPIEEIEDDAEILAVALKVGMPDRAPAP